MGKEQKVYDLILRRLKKGDITNFSAYIRGCAIMDTGTYYFTVNEVRCEVCGLQQKLYVGSNPVVVTFWQMYALKKQCRILAKELSKKTSKTYAKSAYELLKEAKCQKEQS